MARNLMSRAKAALTGKTSTEDQIRGLESTKAGLEARIPALEAAKADALDRRREALISGDDAQEAAQAAREADDNLAAVADALAEVERRLSDAIARRDADEAQAEREAVAKALEADARAIVAAAKDIEAACAMVARAHARMQLAVSAKAAPQVMANRESMSPQQYADGLVLEALVVAIPSLDVRADLFPAHYTMERRVEGREALETAEDAADRLRAVAGSVRSEAAPADLPEWSAGGPRVRGSDVPNVTVFPTACFTFVDRNGQVRRISPSDCYLPEPVANAAVKAGLADRIVGVTHQRAKLDWEGRLERSSFDALFAASGAVDLGVNLKVDAEAKEERQRAAWEADQAAARDELERKAA